MAETLIMQDILDLFKRQSEEFDKDLKIIRKEFDKRIAGIAGTPGSFVEGQVEPRIIDLFEARGIRVTETHPDITIYRNGQPEVEIDLLLTDGEYSIAVEVKTTLSVDDVKEHLNRLDKLSRNPIKSIKATQARMAKLERMMAGMPGKKKDTVVAKTADKKKGFFLYLKNFMF